MQWLFDSSQVGSSEKCLICRQAVVPEDGKLSLDICANCVKRIHKKASRCCAHCHRQKCVEAHHHDVAYYNAQSEIMLGDIARLDNSTLLSAVTSFRTALPISRIKTCLRLGYIPESSGDADEYSIHSSYIAEADLNRQFFADAAHVVGDYLDARWSLHDVAEYFFPVWQLFELVVVCAKNKGYASSRTYWMDGTSWVESVDTQEAQWLCNEANMEVHRMAQLVASSELNDMELSALLLMIFSHYGSPFFVDLASRNAFLSQVCRDLRKSYPDAHYFPIRFDRLTQLFGEFHEAVSKFHESYIARDLISPHNTLCVEIQGYRQWQSFRDRVNAFAQMM